MVSSRNFILKYCYLKFHFLSLNRWLLTILSALFGLEFIDPKSFPLVFWKLSAGLIQIKQMEFLPPQVYWRSWQGLRLGVQNFSYQLIALLDLKHPLSFLFKPFLVFHFCVLHLIDHCLGILKLYLGVLENCQWDLYKMDIQFFSPYRFVGGYGEGDGFVISVLVIK